MPFPGRRYAGSLPSLRQRPPAPLEDGAVELAAEYLNLRPPAP